jgi:CubicO group peptidase (beta-lactamase class C family)
VAVGIVRDGQVVHTLYVGESDLSHHVAIGPSSRFNIASNAKQYTAAVVLQLVQQGRLRLDARLDSILPNALPNIATPITVRMLLTHTSGIRDVYDLWSLAGLTWWRSFVSNADAFALLRRQRGLNLAPGTDSTYSNSNYLLLTEIVRAVTDSTFADVSAARFRAWGMPDTEFLTTDGQLIPNRARPYGRAQTWQEYPSVATVHGDGGLYTTLPDQLVWEQRLQNAPQESMASTLETVSQQPVEGATRTGYGYGVEFGTYAGLPYRFHDGSTGAFNATFLRFPSQRVSVVVMSNSGAIGVRALATRYAEQLLKAQFPASSPYPALPATIGQRVDVSPWLGDYRASTGALISLARTDSGLVRRIPGAPDVRLIADTGNVYRYASNPALKMALDRDAAGAPRFTIYLPTQLPNEGRRLPPAPAAINGRAWVGRYRNDETGAELVISAVTDNRVALTLGGDAQEGTVVRTDRFVANGNEWQRGRVTSGRVDTLFLRTGRSERVVFRRVR